MEQNEQIHDLFTQDFTKSSCLQQSVGLCPQYMEFPAHNPLTFKMLFDDIVEKRFTHAMNFLRA